eukprot:Rmarinus@m.25977
MLRIGIMTASEAPFSKSLAKLDKIIRAVEAHDSSLFVDKPIPKPVVKPTSKPKEKKPAASKKKQGDLPEFSRVDMRVGLIKKAWKHPEADSLYCEEIDVGDDSPRTICSGLVKFIPIEKMENRRCVVICNLKPAKMRGVMSNGMVLCASDKEKTVVEFVEPPADALIGETLTVEGFETTPDDKLNPKKKIWEKVQEELGTSEDLVATYKGLPLMTSAGPCMATTVKNGVLS